MKVVVINSGSSSIKYEVFESPGFSALSSGLLERIGESESQLTHRVYGPKGVVQETVHRGRVANHHEGFRFILSMPGDSPAIKDSAELTGIGHRVVHGGDAFREPVLIDEKVVETIRE
ncbi:MAG: acetate kinase, partial [Planctomycetaceae bacterium]